MNVSDWLHLKFLEWERSEGKRKTMTQFAKYLEVSQVSLSDWLNGKYLPKGQNIGKIANKLGYEIYDILGISRPHITDVDEQVNQLVQIAMQFPPDIQANVLGAMRETFMYIYEQKILDENQVMWVLIDFLQKRLSADIDAKKLASEITGIPRSVFPLAIGFQFERTPENTQRFRDAARAAAKKIDELGIDEDSDEGQSLILEVFASYGFHPMDTSGMNFAGPDPTGD